MSTDAVIGNRQPHTVDIPIFSSLDLGIKQQLKRHGKHRLDFTWIRVIYGTFGQSRDSRENLEVAGRNIDVRECTNDLDAFADPQFFTGFTQRRRRKRVVIGIAPPARKTNLSTV